MALYHFHVGQIKRSAGQSAIACAAYRAGEKLYSEYYGESSDYTRKAGIIYTEIMLPANAPEAYRDRQTLWNAVEQVEKSKKPSWPTASISPYRMNSPWRKTLPWPEGLSRNSLSAEG